MDIAKIWLYDLAWLIIIDLVKIAIIRIQDGPDGEQPSLSTTMSRNSFHGRRSGSKIFSVGGSEYKKSGVVRPSRSMRVSKDIRLSAQGMPMLPKTSGTVTGAPSQPAAKSGALW